MRFKNYRNSFNKRNRIYSDEDLLEMKLAAIFDNENDILAQNRDIGIPTRSELESSQNTQWVEPFVDKNGMNDGGYWQSVLDEKQTPQYQESFIPKNNIGQLFANNVQNEPQYTLEGAIQHNVIQPIQNSIENVKNTYSKYKGLSPIAAAQKALTKNLPDVHLSEKEYYEHGLRRADGEEPTEFMKEQNDFYKLSDIKDENLKKMYVDKLSQMYKKDMSLPENYEQIKNFDIVVPKENSQLHSQIKNSETFQKWVAENYDNIKNRNNKEIKTSLEFPQNTDGDRDKASLFATLHWIDLLNSKVNDDGSLSTRYSDGFDFEHIEPKGYNESYNNQKNDKSDLWTKIKKTIKEQGITMINNNAFEQQELEQFKRYLVSGQIKLNKEEIEEILKKWKH